MHRYPFFIILRYKIKSVNDEFTQITTLKLGKMKRALYVFMFVSAITIVGCREEKSPGEKVDERMEKTGEDMEEAADEVKDDMEEATDDN